MSYKTVGILGTIWSLIGVAMYLMGTQATAEALTETYGAEGGAILAGRPSWAHSAFAIGVFGSLIGSLGLILGKGWSKFLFILSLLGILAQNYWGFSSGMWGHVPTAEKVIAVVVFVIALFLLWYSMSKSKDGTLS